MLRRESGAKEMTLYGQNNTVLATSSNSATASLPKPLTDEVVLQMQQGRPFVSLESLPDEGVEVPGHEVRGAAALGVVDRDLNSWPPRW